MFNTTKQILWLPINVAPGWFWKLHWKDRHLNKNKSIDFFFNLGNWEFDFEIWFVPFTIYASINKKGLWMHKVTFNMLTAMSLFKFKLIKYYLFSSLCVLLKHGWWISIVRVKLN